MSATKAKWRHCIVGISDQYAQARGNFDVEYAVCEMTDGKNRTFETDDSAFEQFAEDREAYWKTNGWHIVSKDGKRTLTPIAP